MIMVNLQIVFSIGIVLVCIGRRNLGGLSINVEDFSRAYSAVDRIDCFPIFILSKRNFLASKENACTAG